MQRAIERMRLVAEANIEFAVECRTHIIRLEPRNLDSIERGLSRLSPKKLAARIKEIRSEVPFASEVLLVNIIAAERYAQQLCDLEERRGRSHE
jgi:hypothetical protein